MQPDHLGPWQIGKKIGSGGMGSVYLARHKETGREAAIKVLPPSLAREEGFVARFTREVQSMQSLGNPHIVEFYEAGQDGESYYYAMEYVEGETLTNLLRREKRIPWQQVVEITIQLCTALKAAHDAGIIHRDLKPSNILIKPDGTVKLTDFGVAQVFAGGKLTLTGSIIGTAEYMSPEQAQGQRATKKSDLYSLGAVMYVMITGRPPFSGKTTLEVIQKHKFGQFDRPNMYVPEIPLWLNDVVCQLMEKDPDKRFPDAYVLSRRLQEMYNRHQERVTDATQAGSSAADADETVVQNHPGFARGLDQNATLMRDLVKAQIAEAQSKGWIGNLLDSTIVLVLLLALLIYGGFYMLGERTLTPEEQFANGVKLMENPAGKDWRKAKAEFFDPLLESDRERWEEKIQPYLDKINEYEATHPVSLKPGGAKQADSEPERWLSLADYHRRVGELDRARQILVALRELLPDDAEHKQLRSRIATRLKLLDESRREQSDWKAWLASSLQRAAGAAKNGRAEEARRICLSIVTLYGEDPAAKEYVRQARALLQRLPPGGK